MVQADSRAAAHAEILRKSSTWLEPAWTRRWLKAFSPLRFPPNSGERIEELSVKANEGTLSNGDEAELEAYINVSDLLALWQSKARQALQRQA